MNPEKVMIAAAMGAVIVLGLIVGVSLATFAPPDSNNGGDTNDTPDLQADIDLLDQSLEAPNWGLIMSDGEVLNLETLEGKFAIIDLMSLNCPACETQNTEFETLIEDMGNNIHIVSLTVDNSVTTAQMADYKEDRSLNWPHGLDTNSVFASYFNIRYTPTLVIIDDAGYFRMYHEGLWESDSIQEQISLLDS